MPRHIIAMQDIIERLSNMDYNEICCALNESAMQHIFVELLGSNCEDADGLCFIGMCYHYVIKNMTLAIGYYSRAVEMDGHNAMCHLAYVYREMENYDEMKRYYLMAIERGHVNSMADLANYYDAVENNYDEMKRYYLMAIERGHVNSMNEIAYYYNEVENNHDEMKRFHLMAVAKNNVDSMRELGTHYEETERNYIEALKYYEMSGWDEKAYRIQRLIMLGKINDTTLARKVETTEDNKCIICHCSYDEMFNFKCLNRHDHYYCLECCKEWYVDSKKNMKCELCTNKIDMLNVVLEIKNIML